MKYNSTFRLILFGFICAFLASSCVKEGPIGPAGLDGEDGVDGQDGQDGNVTCLACHEGNSLLEKQAQFSLSAHSAGAIAVDYAGGRASCAPCHSHEQFVQYTELGEVYGNVTHPSAWECSTCHGIHNEFVPAEFALRTIDPVKAQFDETVTMDLGGTSNLCGVCHQTRRAEPNLTNPGEETFRITSVHYGPHHGPQGNVVYGTGFAEIPGDVAYPAAGSAKHLEQASCTGCHMAPFDKGEGGHSFTPSLKACNDCHGVTEDDFNYGGVQTDTHDKLVELRDMLVDLGVVEFVEEDDAYEPVVGTYPMLQAQAFFNWIGLEEDRSLGVHNPKYVNALLANTIKALEAAQ